ncbi:hypothetical protein GCM10025869_12420 [Homoserinibacter gongjuensis]|uniref:RHS repeat-associated core domain-containing protein n=1 Tax=Homoserinibacter gongjuensis TaxID=1162968 RepID=A0ABQ6JRG7_9MICO|nr:hypothetical protein GCM10025869_12420 [Homoserinibacter gongjuensis]
MLSPANPQQNNGYSYAANNPVTYSDPSGGCYLGGGDTCVHDRPAKKKTGTTTPSSSSQQPSAKEDAPAKKAAKQEEQWWNPFSIPVSAGRGDSPAGRGCGSHDRLAARGSR